MKLWVKLGLFLSSYFPMFLILFIKNFYNLYITIVFILVSLYSIFWLSLLVYDSKKDKGKETYHVLNYEDKTTQSLNYLAPYIISFLGFNLDKWQDWTVLVIFLALIFAVYVNSNLIYMNPLLSCVSRRIYQVEVCNPIECESTKNEILLITKKEHIDKNKKIRIKELDWGVFWGE